MRDQVFKKVLHYLRVYRVIAANSFSYILQYRFDVAVNIFTNILWLAVMFFGIEIIFSNTNSIAGWSKGEIYLLSLIWTICSDVFVAFFGATYDIPDKVTDGNIDLVLTKPLSSSFLSCCNMLLVRAIFRMVVDLLFLIYVVVAFNIKVEMINFLTSLFLFVAGIFIYFSITFIAHTLTFWLERINNISELLNTADYASKYPLDIWPRKFQYLLLSFFPIVFTGYIPTAALLGKLPWYFIIYTPILTIILFAISIKFWNHAIKRYSSASS